MALMNCPKCGSNISDKANSCPNCGEQLYTKEDIKMMICSECGKEIESDSNTCPFCGFPIEKNNIENETNIIVSKTKKLSFNNKKVQIATIISVVLVLIVGIFVITSFSLSRNEKHALYVAKDLQNIMKDPDSFKLREDIVVIVDEDCSYRR